MDPITLKTAILVLQVICIIYAVTRKIGKLIKLAVISGILVIGYCIYKGIPVPGLSD